MNDIGRPPSACQPGYIRLQKRACSRHWRDEEQDPLVDTGTREEPVVHYG